ncbi:probable ATP-dependent RNA helicase ddx56 isoform X1 [Salvelinus sp. IW2-2015]|uniref:probable ATP-dependent RNA helicase ddx56 isoform X1 n=1 Tax=Salvelinus sp. IW2-2015 TaxID=2691554 RepID=UPI000CDF94C4|nr:uncharacterized protein LOC111961515 isoform X1 [Salvelinus alpinus]
MRVEVPIFLFLAATGFHTALAASLESAEKKDTFAEDVGLEQLSDLQKRDQEEFEAAQMNEDAHSEDVRYLEAVQDENTEQNATQEEDMADRDRNVDADHEESESDEDVDGMRHKREYLEADVEANKTANLDFLGQKSRAL